MIKAELNPHNPFPCLGLPPPLPVLSVCPQAEAGSVLSSTLLVLNLDCNKSVESYFFFFFFGTTFLSLG